MLPITSINPSLVKVVQLSKAIPQNKNIKGSKLFKTGSLTYHPNSPARIGSSTVNSMNQLYHSQ